MRKTFIFGVLMLMYSLVTNSVKADTYDPEARLITNASQIENNCEWYGGMSGFLIDGDPYTRFHSDPEKSVFDEDLWMQFDLGMPLTRILFTMSRADSDPIWNDFPCDIIVKATNTPDDEDSWVEVVHLTDGFPDPQQADMQYVSPGIKMSAAYQYVRFIVKNVTTGHGYFNLDEMQIYEAIADEWTYDPEGQLIYAASQIENNCEWHGGMNGFLIDGDPYTRFHSDPEKSVFDEDLWMQFDFEKKLKRFIFTMSRADSDPIWNDFPCDIIVKATNTPGDEDSWVEVAHLTDGFPDPQQADMQYVSPCIEMDQEYQYVRFIVKNVTTDHGYFNLDEMQIYEAIKASGKQDLKLKLIEVELAAASIVPGKDPGCCDEESYNRLMSALEKARQMMDEEHSTEEYYAIINELDERLAACQATTILDITDGYYYFISANFVFKSAQPGVKMALYAGDDGLLRWGILNEEETRFIFRVKKRADGYAIYNMGKEMYINRTPGAYDETNTPIEMSSLYDVPQRIDYLGSGQYAIGNTYNMRYNTQSAFDGAATDGPACAWSSPADGEAAWYLRSVSGKALQFVNNAVIKEIYNNYQEIIDNALTGDQVGYVDEQSCITDFQEAIDNAKASVDELNPTDEQVTNAIEIMNNAYNTFLGHVNKVESNVWYNIASSSSNEDANGQPIFIGNAFGNTFENFVQKDDFNVSNPVPDACWDFENADDLLMNSVDNSAYTLTTAICGDHGITYGDITLESISGPNGNKAVRVKAGDAFRLNLPTQEDVATYTLSWYIRVSDVTAYHALLQTSNDNSSDASVFINRSAQVGRGGNYGGSVIANQWHRITMSVNNTTATFYIDGVEVTSRTADDNTIRNGFFLIFADEDGEYTDIDVAQLAYWNRALTPDDLKVLNGEGLAEANLSIGGYPTDSQSPGRDPYATFRFVPVDGQEGLYYVQNLGTGQYFGAYRGQGASLNPKLSNERAAYKLYYFGDGNIKLQQANINNETNCLTMDCDNNIICNSSANSDLQLFYVETVEEELLLSWIPDNCISILTLPFATGGEYSIAELNSYEGTEVNTYTVKYLSSTDNGSELGLVKKNEIEAGEPFIIVTKDLKSYEGEATSIIIARPEDVVDKSTIVSNGLHGTLTGAFADNGMGVFVNAKLCKSNNTFVPGLSGWIHPHEIANEDGEADLVINASDIVNGVKVINKAHYGEHTNVYAIDGKIVKKNATSAKGLQKGIYIMGKKKIAIK